MTCVDDVSSPADGMAVAWEESGGVIVVRELEASLQQFGEFLPKAPLVKEKAAPYWVRWVRRFR